MTFDWTINLGHILTLIATLSVGIKVVIGQRDFNRDVKAQLGVRGSRETRSGVLGDVQTLEEEVLEPGGAIHRIKNELHKHEVQLALVEKRKA